MIQKLQAIPNPKFEISYPRHEDVDAMESIQACLQRNPDLRARISGTAGLIHRNFLRINMPSENSILSKHSSNRKQDNDVKEQAFVNISTVLEGESSSNRSPRQNVSRYPLRTLSTNLQNQIQSQSSNVLQKNETRSRGDRWMKPKPSPRKNDLRSVLEKRFEEIR
jgi:hypothetical protein